MKQIGWIFLVSLALQLLSSSSRGTDTSRWQSIDCGREVLRLDDNLLTWKGDHDFTQTGSNKLVRINTTRDEFNTLRAFPNGTKDDCYNVPIDKQMIRYIIRVGFYYGNYDGLFKPPTFDLYINNIKWTTINTSINGGEPVYEEIIHPNKGSELFKICLVQIQDGGIPLINSIETVGIFHTLYPELETNTTYNLVTRINFGGPEVRYDLETDEEMYNRIWSKGASVYANVSGLPAIYALTSENYPPTSVMADAIESNASDPITLTIDIPLFTPQSAYIVLYIPELGYSIERNQTRSIKIEFDGQDQGTVDTLAYGESTVVSKYPVIVSGPTINITLSRADESKFPPMIAAVEVFTKWDTDKSAAAPEYISFAYTLMVLFVLLLVA